MADYCNTGREDESRNTSAHFGADYSDDRDPLRRREMLVEKQDLIGELAVVDVAVVVVLARIMLAD